MTIHIYQERLVYSGCEHTVSAGCEDYCRECLIAKLKEEVASLKRTIDTMNTSAYAKNMRLVRNAEAALRRVRAACEHANRFGDGNVSTKILAAALAADGSDG